MAEFIDIVLKDISTETSHDEVFVEVESPVRTSLNIGFSYIDEEGFRRIRIKPSDIINA